MKSTASVSHDEYIIGKIKSSPVFAAEYLKAALEDTEEPEVLRIALRQFAEAKGGMAKFSAAVGVPRGALKRALSPSGETTLSIVQAVVKAAGMKLSVEPAA